MNKFIEFIKKNGILLVILFSAPVIVILVFTIKEYILNTINLSAGDWANLLGALFSYWGTVLLGVLAFWQNDRLVILEERNLEIQEIQLQEEQAPNFSISHLICYVNNVKTQCDFSIRNSPYGQMARGKLLDKNNDAIRFVTIHIYIENITMCNAYDIEAIISDTRYNLIEHPFKTRQIKTDTIGPKQQIILVYSFFFNNPRKNTGWTLNFKICYRNSLFHYYYNEMTLLIRVERKSNIGELSIRLNSQEKGEQDVDSAVNGFIG